MVKIPYNYELQLCKSSSIGRALPFQGKCCGFRVLSFAQMMYPVVKGFVDLFRVGKRKIELTTQITSIISQVVKLVATACKSTGIVLKTYE